MKRNFRDGDGGGVYCFSVGSEYVGIDLNVYGCWGYDVVVV